MLQSLHIVNFAIIEDTVIEFGSGVTVFTGETGAGKSILIDALAVLTGRRARTDLIRTRADFFKVEGVFYADKKTVEELREEGLEGEGSQVILSRKLNRSGRGLCTINGNFCTVKQLQKLGKKLVRLHEQNDNMELLSIPFCERMVDSGTEEAAKAYQSYRESYGEWKKLKDALEDYKERKQERERRLDILEWELNQIREAGLQEGEDEEVERKLQVLQNHEKIIRSIHNALDTITADGGPQDAMAEADKELSTASRYDETLNPVLESVRSASFALEDAVSSMEDYLSTSDFSEEDLAALQDRNEVIQELKRKYGPELSDVLSYAEKAQKEYDSLKEIIYDNKALQKNYEDLTETLMKKAEVLNAARIRSSETILEKVVASLKDMGMENARMKLHLLPQKTPLPNGAAEMEFYFSANLGEPLRSMKDTASGGEISRIALSIEMVISNLLRQQTLIFDEIDVGISGKVGLQVARKIALLSHSIQVLCITHLPQTACAADRHYKIVKTVSKGRTATKAVLLDPEEHLRDIALMISGSDSSESALKSAAEMKKKVKGV
ncbi:DNA repair protein RecN [uncultured Dialister sp.]|jgi:DNA repair protein RecN (Recombination protein N)|uniref:DNA repair protein RecN n=1 Tax=uncultured Dialister sp. TaxID=278064 RepID=UPI0025FE8161|nr:DNA repair protein RecN [uncultured Dialister sp.]